MDRKQLTTALAAVGVLLIAASLGLRLWSNTERLALPQLSMVHVGPDGRVYTLLADTFYVTEADGSPVQEVPLSRLGIGGFWGDFAVLGDGSVILPAGKQPPDSVQKELRIAMREPASGDASPDAVPLSRCSLQDFTCTPLTGTPASDYFRADRTFKLAVDEAAGRLYVADTAAQRLLILDLEGRILARKAAGLAFPNQLELASPGVLRVADTNHNRLLEIPVTGDAFAEPGVSLPVQAWSRRLGFEFPVGLTQDRLDHEWVVLADENISHGRLYRLPHSTHAEVMPLPEGSDVLFLAATDREVLAADAAHYAIHAYGLDGQALPDFGTGPLQVRLQELAAKHDFYDLLFSGSLVALMVIGALLFMLLMLLRIYPQGDAPASAIEGAESMPGPGIQTPDIAWRGKAYEFRRRAYGALDASSRRAAYFLIVLVFAAPVSLLAYLQSDLASHGHVTPASEYYGDPRFWCAAIAFVIMVINFLLSRRYERLTLDYQGLRYTSWVAGPIRFLVPLWPDWHLRWDELADIRLVAKGSRPMMWYYELRPKAGGVRRIGVFVWGDPEQPDETGLTLRDLFQRDPVRYKAALAQTRLFALLELAVRARKQDFRHSLIEG